MADTLAQLGIDPSIAPQPSPALLTYLRGLGLDMATIQEQKQRTLATVAANKIRQDQAIAEASKKANENQVADAAARGVSRSGENDKGLAEIGKNTLQAYGDSAANAASAADSAERDAQSQTMGLTRNATEYLLGLNEQQQRDAAQQAAYLETEKQKAATQQEQFDAYMALLREQGAAANQPYQNPYEAAQQGINAETYAGLGAAPPETNMNLGFYGSSNSPISPGYSGGLMKPPSSKSRYVKAV